MSMNSAQAKRVTVSDIAAGCGVSRATVSLVLRESPLVHADTRARVQAEIVRQGYVYHRGAASLRRGTSNAVALVLNDLSNPFFAEFAGGVDAVLAEAGYVMLLGSTGESPQRQQAVLASLIEHDPAALILSPAEHSEPARLQRLLGTRMPVLVFNRALGDDEPGDGWDFLALDNRNGARMATEHLLAQGHRAIAFFGGHRDSSSCSERRAGYRDALAAAGIEPDPQWLVECAPTRLEATRQTGALFARDPAPTAAVCYNDAVALGLIGGLAARGRQAGRDFAVVGFDDIPEAAVSTPPLSTIAVAPRERGMQAARLILARLRGDSDLPRRIVAPVQLRVRASSVVAPTLSNGASA
ncbi:transcriptional regulator, LacI family [Luteimonas cucumeris]|uniref:Transcriptional regulator, LacI family n=1 Tax=Luteimonas cucumeris TaxID=985012 RepID=A0A562L208_9GAMM|nr:LacI family DNA-binding transcriptional regulator [Luteimonas cucumeris]TWI01700.1 transcriptional regulator, LacI family [Luteimonas cucumeris]